VLAAAGFDAGMLLVFAALLPQPQLIAAQTVAAQSIP
jgi:hypothetical protein